MFMMVVVMMVLWGRKSNVIKKNSFQRSIGSYRDAPQSVSVVAKLK